jgi:MHS family proline/betaine transporter-like MFS transporter
VPFFMAAPLGLLGLYLRHAAEETPAFQQQLDMMEKADQEDVENTRPRVSFKEIATRFWRPLLICVGLVLTTNITYYMLLTYMPSYLSHNLHYAEGHGVLIIIAVMIGMLFVQPLIGMASDRFGRRPFVLVGSVALLVLAIPCFHLIVSGQIGFIFLGLFVLAIILNAFTGVMASTLPALFPTRIRYSALASAFNIAVIAAGMTPTVAAALVDSTGSLYIPAYYLMAVSLVGIATGLFMKETANQPLRGATPSASSKQEARELLEQTYGHIEQRVEDVDAEIARLQKQIQALEVRKQQLIELHPHLD